MKLTVVAPLVITPARRIFEYWLRIGIRSKYPALPHLRYIDDMYEAVLDPIDVDAALRGVPVDVLQLLRRQVRNGFLLGGVRCRIGSSLRRSERARVPIPLRGTAENRARRKHFECGST